MASRTRGELSPAIVRTVWREAAPKGKGKGAKGKAGKGKGGKHKGGKDKGGK